MGRRGRRMPSGRASWTRSGTFKPSSRCASAVHALFAPRIMATSLTEPYLPALQNTQLNECLLRCPGIATRRPEL